MSLRQKKFSFLS